MAQVYGWMRDERKEEQNLVRECLGAHVGGWKNGTACNVLDEICMQE